VPDNPDGSATYYGSRWFLGENRIHIYAEEARFYKSNDTADFYMRRQTSGLTSHTTFYIYRDQLDRLSFYTDRASALRGDPARRVQLYPTDFQRLVLALRGSDNYESAIVHCTNLLGEYSYSDARDEVTLASICADAPRYERWDGRLRQRRHPPEGRDQRPAGRHGLDHPVLAAGVEPEPQRP